MEKVLNEVIASLKDHPYLLLAALITVGIFVSGLDKLLNVAFILLIFLTIGIQTYLQTRQKKQDREIDELNFLISHLITTHESFFLSQIAEETDYTFKDNPPRQGPPEAPRRYAVYKKERKYKRFGERSLIERIFFLATGGADLLTVSEKSR